MEDRLVIQLQDDFYRDSFGRVMLLAVSLLLAIILLSSLSVYLYINKPKPVSFQVGTEWRILSPIPVDQPYVSTPQLLQWVSDVMRNIIVFDFSYYNEQLKSAEPYFTEPGWKIFLNQLSNYADRAEVEKSKMFINGKPAGAPTVLNRGVLSGRYAWWVEMPIDIAYVTSERSWSQSLTLQILVVRIPTLNNLSGIAIDNIIVAKSTGGLA